MYFHHFPFHDPETIDSVFGISISLLGVIATFFSTIVLGGLAIFGDQLKGWILRPKIKGVESIMTWQEIDSQTYFYHRLIVKNVGYVAAKDVRVFLTYLNNSQVVNFIPVPLNWTHWNTRTRDISKKEPAYIDVLRRADLNEPYNFCWSYEVGIPWERDLTNFDERNGNLRLEFYERDSKVGDIVLAYSKEKDKLSIV